ncbi:vacuolar protein sorting 55 [Metschnikowia bicuspidata var. bicuspidata NRRL YB-4993]|uniref:Vacuolar protein sorting 55 n=1 Tax=Metschnikowia bicuspidata var. bicuspidata NRRL YB-4993 TaxID=869754 RepID=A0A1A0HHQ7_9ASCO|nr:vacuolar protein sorting 55 [Metschnikowia bicuspidata var. bicuspidata NRRL YB-4993]OBA23378.1 vacuolar protein sorting 55 [Metschnikowia bicuspidata var. bicuspidata NRRL YB-4993]
MNSTQQFGKNPLNKIIGLSIVLSMGFLLVVLAGVSGNWFPIVDGVIFAVSYLPVIISRVAFTLGDNDFNFDPSISSHTLAAQELGKFLTAALLVTGFYIPFLLHHSHFLSTTAMILTFIGGLLIYGTVYTFSQAFEQSEDDEAELGAGVI